MTKRILRACAVAGAPAVLALLQTACGDGSSQTAPQKDFSSLDSSTRRDALAPGDASAPQADAGSDDSNPPEIGTSADTGSALDGRPLNVSDSPPPPSVSECVAGHSWTGGREWVPDSIARFGGVSSNGLTLAWTQTTGGVLTADRLNEFSDFKSPLGAPPSVTLQTAGRVALDPSGTLLLAIDATGTGFVVWQRTPGQGWLSSASSAFDQMIAPNATPGTTVSEPVFGASGDSFFFLLTPPADSDASVDATAPAPPPTLYESRLSGTGGTWGPGVAVTNQELTSADAAHRRRPTGASSDDRTLFFYDEVVNVERAAWRRDPSSPFAHFEDIPAAPEAAPNAGCSLLYFRGTNPSAGTQGINVAM